MGRSGASLLRDVGRRVAELRVAHGWTQEVFAERADVSVGYVRQVEAGRENLTLTSLAKVSALLGVDAAELFSPPASRERRRGRPPKRAAKEPQATPAANTGEPGAVAPASANEPPSPKRLPAPSHVPAHPRKTRQRT